MAEQRPATDWDRYWRGTWEAAAHEDGSPQDAALAGFWKGIFALLPTGGEVRLLDVAAGNGAVVRHVRGIAGQSIDCYALDYSLSALRNLRQRYAGVRCVAADALCPPLAPRSFDAVVSQYGIEYAGTDAIAAAGDLVRQGGYLALVIHYRDGAIYSECADNRRVLLAIKSLNVLPLARDAFRAGFALNAGRGAVAAFREAERAFTPAVRGLEQLLQRERSGAAGGLLQQLYRDIAAMYSQMSAYAEEDVMGWLDGMGPELDAYIGRMQSMVDAALDEPALRAQCNRLTDMGFESPRCERLRIGASSRPAAWTLVARRGGS
jgi:SAM-dependent methyltransferase